MIWICLIMCVIPLGCTLLLAAGYDKLEGRVRALEEDMPLPDKWRAPDIDTESDDVP